LLATGSQVWYHLSLNERLSKKGGISLTNLQNIHLLKHSKNTKTGKHQNINIKTIREPEPKNKTREHSVLIIKK